MDNNEQIHLGKWFRLKTEIPLIAVLTIFLLTLFSLGHFFYKLEKSHQEEILNKYAEILNKGIYQKDRSLIESILSIQDRALSAHSTVLCKKNKVIASTHSYFSSCEYIKDDESFYWKLLKCNIQNETQYTIYTLVPRIPNMHLFILITIIILLSVLICTLIIFKLKKSIRQDLLTPIKKMLSDDMINVKEKHNISEIYTLHAERKKIIEKNNQKETSNAMLKQSIQICHDIRSPLIALKTILATFSHIEEEKRIAMNGAIQRIQDIANSSLEKNRKKSANLTNLDENKNLEKTLIYCSLEEVISEKRIEFTDKKNININLSCTGTALNLFCKINVTQFKRVISNLINNSIEAYDPHKNFCKIDITLKEHDNNQLIIIIKDNGKGINKDQLNKIGKPGVSYGKTEGNGIGLFHAIRSSQEWNGDLKLSSEIKKGTTISITLPRCNSPKWFISQININEIKNIIILDDDQGIHHVWDLHLKKQGIINVLHFYTAKGLENYIKNEENYNTSDTLYLFDYDLIQSQKTGLDLIKEYSLQKNSILVTSHFNNKDIILEIEHQNIKLIPKLFAENISFYKKDLKSQYDLVHIDDDRYIRYSWIMAAQNAQKKILSIENPNQLKSHLNGLEKNTHFYIDSFFGENTIKGELFAKELYDQGFKNLYLSTGYDNIENSKVPWIKKIIDKSPPWENTI